LKEAVDRLKAMLAKPEAGLKTGGYVRRRG